METLGGSDGHRASRRHGHRPGHRERSRTLLLKGGTRLSSTMVNKLVDLLPPLTSVPVMAA